MKELLNEAGAITLSLPHAAHCAVISRLFEEDFRCGEWGLLEKTHIGVFGLRNIHALHAGLAITDARFVNRRPEQPEFAKRWATLPKRIALSSSRYGHLYQLITSAVPVEKVSVPVDLFEASARGSVSSPPALL